MFSYANFIGFFAAFPIFNQVYVGTNLSLLWVLILVTPLIYGADFPEKSAFLIMAFLAIAAIKFIAVFNVEAIVRYIVYIAFVAAAAAGLRRKRLDEIFAGFEVGLICNVAFACIQMFGLLTGLFDAIFPVRSWNPSLWHYNPPGGMILVWPRVSGFANEPAYLGTLMIAAASYRLLVQKKRTLTGPYGIYLFLVIMVLVNSRTSFFSYIWLVACSVVMSLRSWTLMTVSAVGMYLCSFVILPAAIMFRSDEVVDYRKMMLEDISVFSRTAPIIWIKEGNHLSTLDYFIGVSNYREYAPTVSMPPIPLLSLRSQGALLDPKSLGAAYFYDLGFLGIIGFVAVLYFVCGGGVSALLLISAVNVSFFNVYAFSWPLFWLMIMCSCLLADRRRGRLWTRKITSVGPSVMRADWRPRRLRY